MRLRAALMLISVCLGVSGVTGAERPSSDLEYQVKAALMLNFARFTDYPTPTTPYFVVGVLGGDPFGFSLDRVMEGKVVKGRPIMVRRLVHPEEARECDLLYVSASERKRFRQILDAIGRRSVLTISDLEGFTASGGMIEFFEENGRVRFEINLGAAQPAGLRFRSQLLELARIRERSK